MKPYCTLWQLIVFCSEGVRGNPTGVLMSPPPDNENAALLVACRLGFPDSVYLWEDAGQWRTRTFSPSGELAFCTQTLIGASTVLRLAEHASIVGNLSLGVGSQSFNVSLGEHGVHWVDFPSSGIALCEGRRPLLNTLGIKAPSSALATFDTGRRRVYCFFPNREALHAVSLHPEAVVRYCHDADVNGICLLSLDGPGEVSLRVFTTSLDGHEDAATGGAVAALPRFLARTGVRIAAEQVWKVHQGSGPSHRRGEIFVREDRSGKVFLGGRSLLVAKGTITQETLEPVP